ncbi:MAG: Kazal-type serine protease inhibitor family protein [Myxococcota bacterium]
MESRRWAIGMGILTACFGVLVSSVAWGSGDACALDSDCGAGNFCERDPLSCAGPGTCEALPEACMEIYDPVCGCDGVTYSNSCYATIAGTGVAQLGECNPVSDCLANGTGDVCSELFYCAVGPGQCEDSVPGTCEAMPQACPYNWDPVCGCDGVTYANACAARAEGINVAQAGECVTVATGVPVLSSGYAALLLALLVSGVGMWTLGRVRSKAS